MAFFVEDHITGCDITVVNSVDLLLQRINEVIRQNLYTLLLCLVIVGLCITVIVFCVRQISVVVAEHNSHVTDKMVKKINRDDIIYPRQIGIGDAPMDPEDMLIKSKMAKITSQYTAYNRALADQLKSLGRVMDDRVDSSILDRREDEFKYTQKKDGYVDKRVVDGMSNPPPPPGES